MRYLDELGLSVPEDISVTGFDNLQLAAYVKPALTTFHQPKHELGTEAALMILRALDRKNESKEPSSSDAVILEGKLIERGSTRAI